jgi:hypothetical protein
MAAPIPIRATSHLSKLALFSRSSTATHAAFSLVEGEEVFGMYRNNPDVSTQAILVTSNGLHIQFPGQVRYIPYGEIAQIHWFTWDPGELVRPDNRRLSLEFRSGERVEIFVAGAQGVILDVVGFHNFLLAAVQTRQMERRRTVNR